jgi:hypothetical protein
LKELVDRKILENPSLTEHTEGAEKVFIGVQKPYILFGFLCALCGL